MSKSMMVAVIALFFSLTGWGAAARMAMAPANTVNTQSIVNGSIRLADLHPSAVRALKGQKGDTGADGMDGAVGPAGPAGPAGVPDASLSSRLSDVEKVADAICPKYGLPSNIVTGVSLIGSYLSVKTVSCPFRF